MSELRTNRIVPRNGLPSGASGGVIQVVEASDYTSTAVTSGSFVDTGLSASITPTNSSNNILVYVSHNVYKGSTNNYAHLILAYSSGGSYSTLGYVDDLIAYTNDTLGAVHRPNAMFMHSPATTSTITYKTQCKVTGGTFYFNGDASSGTQQSRGSIVLMEVSG
tara:strand:- start:52 stop:543 length:492 start_codon:yes stop_codon:yes gene_type:complete